MGHGLPQIIVPPFTLELRAHYMAVLPQELS